MKTLLLLRHSEAETESPFFKDHDRELTPSGIQIAAILGQELSERGFKTEKILTSSAIRAYTTAQVVGEKIGFGFDNIDSYQELYNASPRVLFDVLCHLPTEIETVLLVNHNMGISFFAESLTKLPFTLLPCGVVWLQFETNSWADIQNKTAKVVWKHRC